MRKYILLGTWSLCGLLVFGQPGRTYKVEHVYHIPSSGWWDYIAVNEGRIYVSHGTQVNILDEKTGDSVGVIPNTNGVHGIAFDNARHRGYTSNGRTNNVTVFELGSNKVITEVGTGQNPDAIAYEPYSKTIITCNGRSNDLSVIDPKTEKVIATVSVGGKPETGVADGKGRFYVNIEDKSEIAVVNTKTFKVEARWPLAPGTGPSGLDMDRKSNRLFAGCDNKMMVVMDAGTGKVVAHLPIGDGCDGLVFDVKRKEAIASCGAGVITVVKEDGPDKFTVVGNFDTKRGARTITIDEKDGTLFLPTAEFGEAAKGTRPPMVPGSFQVLVVR